MKTIFRNLLEPFKSITQQPYQFIGWLLIANVLGLAGFWLPLFLLYGKGLLTNQSFDVLLNAGNLASFSVVILADGITALLFTKGTGSNMVALGMRGVASGLAFIFILIQVVILADAHITTTGQHIDGSLQITLTLVAIAIACYLYCFRFPIWEKGVAELKAEEDKEVSNLADAAAAKSADDKGVKL